ncbi:MAG: AfsR/SARP family transcriptional regulator [Geminicoccaceae bacterium]
MIEIKLFGGFSATLEAEQRRLPIPPRAAKLLTYCLFHRACRHSREHLIDLFWPETPLEQAQSSLNSTLSRLRCAIPKDIGPVIVSEGREALGLADSVKLSTDVDAFVHDVRIDEQPIDRHALRKEEAAQLKSALDLYRGDLLPGWYDDWLLVERERLRHLYIVGLSRLMTHFGDVGALELAISYGRRLLALEPLREQVHRSMMDLYMRSGHRAAALKQYAQCCELLEEELGVEPMEETQDLYANIADSGDSNSYRLVKKPRKEAVESRDRHPSHVV